MTRSISVHIRHHHSRIDGREIPMVVQTPTSGPPTHGVILLHDVLTPMSREQFIESALLESARWRAALEESLEAVALVQPMGRGNAGWLGAGGRDLLDAIEELGHSLALDDTRWSLAGLGAGATAALQLACWFPDRWSSLAIAGGVADDHWELGIDQTAFPLWQEEARRSVRPAHLLKNWSGRPVWIEHPWWFDGVAGTVSPREHQRLGELFERAGADVTLRANRPILAGETVWPAQPAELIAWLLGHRDRELPASRHFKTFTPRSQLGEVRVDRFLSPGKPASVRLRQRNGSTKVKTVGAMELALAHPGSKSLDIDGQMVPLPKVSSAPWVRFERWAESWRPAPQSDGALEPEGPIKSANLAGPIGDMRWSDVMFVPGTLGDDFETRSLRRIAEEMSRSWTDGRDSSSIHPGNRSEWREYPVMDDAQVDLAAERSHHLVLIGSPRTNLMLARHRAGLACEWIDDDAESSVDGFRLMGKSYLDPEDGLFLLGGHPRYSDRYLLVVTGSTTDALVWSLSYPTAFMPDYVVYRGPKVAAWGHCGHDWLPV